MKNLDAKFLEVVQSREPVSGYTHEFYRYPARFSPLFAREAIRAFSLPGDTIFDPFMGGGTSLVEAHLQGRNAVGADVNQLAVFVARVKTTPMAETDLDEIRSWADSLEDALNLWNPAIRDTEWIRLGYQRNISTRKTWRIRKTLELALARIPDLASDNQRQFARCVLLRTAQWALDCRTDLPRAIEVREQFRTLLNEMIDGATQYAQGVRSLPDKQVQIACLHRSAVGVESDAIWKRIGRPKLIITSPPYPGVHVLYHRWQIQGRKETPAPFWISGTLDGSGSSFYTFGDRKQRDLSRYYEQARAAFRSLAKVADEKAMLVQMV